MSAGTATASLVRLGAVAVAPRLVVRQTETFRQSFTMKRKGEAVDITGWTLKARAEFYFVGSDASDTVLGDRLTPIADHDDVELTTGIDNAEAGLWYMDVPGDLYTGEIAINEVRAVPMALVWLTITEPIAGSQPDKTSVQPYIILIRRAKAPL